MRSDQKALLGKRRKQRGKGIQESEVRLTQICDQSVYVIIGIPGCAECVPFLCFASVEQGIERGKIGIDEHVIAIWEFEKVAPLLMAEVVTRASCQRECV